jgi:type I restriction enzyme M protein
MNKKPYAPEAWIDYKYVDSKDKNTGRIGYEINFNRYFRPYQPHRSLDAIDADIKTKIGDLSLKLEAIAS